MSSPFPATYGAGIRLPSRDLPPAVVAWLEAELGGRIVRHDDKHGGFSPGVASVVTSDAGTRAFVKAVGGAVNPQSIEFMRAEAAVAGRLPDHPGLMRPLASADLVADGEEWCVVLFPVIDGRPPRHPWDAVQARRVLDAIDALATALTPSPWPDDEERDAKYDDFFRGWSRVVRHPEDPWHDNPWVTANLDRLVALETAGREALGGDTLSQRDMRADNLLLTDDTVWIVDWAHAGNTARWFDAVVLLTDIVASRADVGDGGSIDVVRLMHTHPSMAAAEESVQWGIIAGLAATLHRFAQTPAPPGLPTIRGWQSQTADDILRFVTRALPAGL